jgi:hypothetical protein
VVHGRLDVMTVLGRLDVVQQSNIMVTDGAGILSVVFWVDVTQHYACIWDVINLLLNR